MSNTRTKRARSAAESVQSNQYVRRLIEDEDLRNSIREAYDAGRSAYGRLQKQRRPAQALMDDRKVHRELRDAAENLRHATDRLRGREQRSHGFLKLVVLAVAGAAVAMVLSEDLRKAVLDRLFGAEEEFEYTSATAPANGGPAS